VSPHLDFRAAKGDVGGMRDIFAGLVAALVGLTAFAAVAFLAYGFIVSFIG
jgi:hypothetical protein